jgi:hypothetical protein
MAIIIMTTVLYKTCGGGAWSHPTWLTLLLQRWLRWRLGSVSHCIHSIWHRFPFLVVRPRNRYKKDKVREWHHVISMTMKERGLTSSDGISWWPIALSCAIRPLSSRRSLFVPTKSLGTFSQKCVTSGSHYKRGWERHSRQTMRKGGGTHEKEGMKKRVN